MRKTKFSEYAAHAVWGMGQLSGIQWMSRETGLILFYWLLTTVFSGISIKSLRQHGQLPRWNNERSVETINFTLSLSINFRPTSVSVDIATNSEHDNAVSITDEDSGEFYTLDITFFSGYNIPIQCVWDGRQQSEGIQLQYEGEWNKRNGKKSSFNNRNHRSSRLAGCQMELRRFISSSSGERTEFRELEAM